MKRPISLTALSVTLLLCACASTTFTSTWKAPDVQALSPAGKRIATAFISNDESSRRAAEDTLARRLDERGAQGVPSYTLVPSGDLRDMDRVKASLTQAGIDGVLTMRVIEERQRIPYTPASPTFAPYMRFSSFWPYGWGGFYDLYYEPQRMTTDTEVLVETLVYSLNRDELLWAGTSRTLNPADVPKFVDQLADAAATQMRREGLLARGTANQ